MEINNEELQKDLEEQYAMLEEEVEEDKKKKRFLFLLVCFLCLFLFMFGTAFSYYKVYEGKKVQQYERKIELYIEGYEKEFVFDESIHEYALQVKPKTTSVTFRYVLKCKNCKIDIKGADNLKPGDNIVIVKVIDDDLETEEEYIVHVIVPDEDEPDTPVTPTTPENPDKRNLDLISLDVENHKLNIPFDRKKTSYITKDVMTTENVVNVSFELYDKRNKVELKLNGASVTRPIIIKGNLDTIWFNINTELHLGANKLEIIVKDDDGNSKTYNLFIIVNKPAEPTPTEDGGKNEEKIEEKVIEIVVEYENPTTDDWTLNTTAEGNVLIAQIVPGWESNGKQSIKITNKSAYSTNVDIKWTKVSNNFTNKNDLEYIVYKDGSIIKTGKLPSSDETILTNVNVPANSENRYYIGYKYVYREDDQNVDQGKEFKSTINVTLTK